MLANMSRILEKKKGTKIPLYTNKKYIELDVRKRLQDEAAGRI